MPEPETIAAGPAGTGYGQDPLRNLAAVEDQVRKGLPAEQPRLLEARINQDFYDTDSEQYVPIREAENDFDYSRRPKRTSALTRQVIDKLSGLYPPGPSRRLEGDAAADKYIAEVFEANHVNTLLQEADRLALLNDVALLQVAIDPTDPVRPVCVHVLGAEEFAVWTSPTRPTEPWAVCTIARFEGGDLTRYQVFTTEQVRTYYGRDADKSEGAIALAPAESGRNPYGCLPFVAIHNRLPTRKFWGSGIGRDLRRANARVDDRLSDLDHQIAYYTRPLGFTRGVAETWRPTFRPGSFQQLPPAQPGGAVTPEAFYLQAQLDVAGVWEDLHSYVDMKLTELGLPLSIARGEASGVMSGIALMVEQVPLLNLWKDRQPLFTLYETALCRKILTAAGNFLGRPELLASAARLDYCAHWPEPVIPLPLPERNETDLFEVSNGLMSQLQIVQRRFGMTRDQAIQHLEQVAEDQRERDRIFGLQQEHATGGDPAAGGDTSEVEPE